MFRSFGASAPVGAVAEKLVVLVVEEEPIFRAATAKRLRAGFEVFEAANSAEAELIQKNTAIDAMMLPREVVRAVAA
jgi:CheY-like chemotaxis protein